MASKDERWGRFHQSITCIEGGLLLVYLVGVLFIISKVTFQSVFIEVPRAILVMLLVPLTPALVPFLIYTAGFIISQASVEPNVSPNRRKLLVVQSIYGIVFLMIVIYYVWKYVL